MTSPLSFKDGVDYMFHCLYATNPSDLHPDIIIHLHTIVGPRLGISACCNGVFPLPETDSYTETETDECTDIGGKMGTVPKGIGLCTCIGLRIGSVETVLYITIEAISICLCLGLGIGRQTLY